MKKTILSIIALTLIFYDANCQELKIGLTSGIGFYSMSGLKEINKEVQSGLPFDTKVVADFPPYFYYQPSLMVQYNKFAIGFFYTYNSTGSRVSGKDYSGEYHFDMTVVSKSPGFYIDGDLNSANNFKFSIYSTLSISSSTLKINQYLNVLDSVIANETINFKAQNLYFEPGLKLSYSFKKITFSVNAGFSLLFTTQGFYTGNNKDNKLYLNNSQKAIKPGWNGLRIGLSLFYNLSGKVSY